MRCTCKSKLLPRVFLLLKPRIKGYKLAILGLLAVLLAPRFASAQEFSSNLGEFANEFEQRLKDTKFPQAVEFAAEFREAWDAEYIKRSDKFRIINQTNFLMQKGWRLVPQVMVYMRSTMQVRRSGQRIKISAQEYFPVTDSVIKYYTTEECIKYFKTLEKFVQRGIIYETSQFRWFFTQKEPRLRFVKEYDPQAMDTLRFPQLHFTDTDIVYHSREDTSKFRGTRGFLNLFSRDFIGDGGYYDWSRLGLDPSDVYAELFDYKVNLTLTVFKIDTVRFHYKSLLSKPLIGSLEERISHHEDVNNAEFPYFRSLEGGITIENFIQNMTYEGGFSLRGVTKVGSRTAEQLATLHMYTPGGTREILKLEADEFTLDTEKMSTDEAHVTVFLPDDDSLYHGSMKMIYHVEDGELILLLDRRSKKSRQPITSSYHNMNFYFDAIRWYPEKDSLRFTAYVAQEFKSFAAESYDYFKRIRFYQYKGVLKFNPIGMFYRFWKEHRRKRRFTVDEFLSTYQLEGEKEKLILAMPDLVGGGFVEFDEETEQITLLKRTILWGMAAAKQKDYDAIQLISRVDKGNNGILRYSTKELMLRGVHDFAFSDSQKVDVFPQEEKVFLEQDRNMHFGGKMRGGIMDFFGSGYDRFNFNYEDFKIYMDSVDYIGFNVDRHPVYMQQRGKTRLQKALERLQIEGVNGALYVNRPENKSGKKVYPEYPVFDCYTESFKYWNDSTKWNGGVYDRDLVHFTLDPFVIDSIEDLDIRALEFHGEYYAHDIVPEFRDTLKPVRDDTYGLSEKMPENGVSLYGGKGKFFNMLHVDGSAMWGDGEIHYLNTVAVCDSFVYHIDSVFSASLTQDFYLKSSKEDDGSEYPSIAVQRIKYIWYPRQDKLTLRTDGEPADLYDGEAKFFGEINITPEGVQGAGMVEIGNVQIESDFIDFKQDEVEVQDGTFIVTDPEIPTKQHFKAENVAVLYDMEEHTSDFQSVVSGRENMSFPQQRWTTSLGMGNFDRASGTLKLAKKTTQPAGRFSATDPAKHGLNFTADSSVYVMEKEKVEIAGVDSIIIADATIFPDSMDVTIDSKGDVEPLNNAELAMNNTTRYHRLFDGSVKIKSGINYTASAKYEYKQFSQEEGSNVITFADLWVLPDTTSRGKGIIPEEQNFYISNRIIFRDTVELIAGERFLRFAGEVRIDSDNPALRDSWFAFADTVNPDSVFIPFEGDPQLTVGLHFFQQYRNFYVNFLTPKKDKKNEDVLLAKGFLTVDPRTLEFRIGSKEKLAQNQYRGNVVSYNDSSYIITCRGFYNYPYHFNEDLPFKMEMAGEWRQKQNSNDAQTTMFIGLTFPDFPKGAIDILQSRGKGLTQLNPDMDITSRLLHESMAEFTEDPEEEEEKNIKKLVNSIEEITSLDKFDLMKYIDHQIVFANVPLEFCNSTNTFYANGPVGLVGVDGETFNKQVYMKMTYSIGRKKPGAGNIFFSDTLRIYFSFDEEDFDFWYVEMAGNQVYTTSSIEAYNQRITEGVEKQKEPKDDEMEYVAAPIKYGRETFIQRFSSYLLNGCGE